MDSQEVIRLLTEILGDLRRRYPKRDMKSKAAVQLAIEVLAQREKDAHAQIL